MSSFNPDSSQVDTSSNLTDECSTFRTPQNHWTNIEKFGSCPLRCKTLVSPGFFAFLANVFAGDGGVRSWIRACPGVVGIAVAVCETVLICR
jgi:hypothetical protein